MRGLVEKCPDCERRHLTSRAGWLMIALGIALFAWLQLAACTFHVDVTVRPQPVAIASPVDAGATLYYGGIGLYANDGGVFSTTIAIGGCEPTKAPPDGGFCESPCAMPVVNCGQWSSMQYDGCRWACRSSVPIGAATLDSTQESEAR